MCEAGLGDVSSIEMVERLRLRHGRFKRIVRDLRSRRRACSDCWYGKMVAWHCEWRLVRVDLGMAWRRGVVEDCCNKS